MTGINPQSRPSFMDYALFLTLMMFSAAPLMIQNGILSEQLVFLHRIFPHGYFLIALGVIILKTVVPTRLFEFSLPLTRWVTIIGIFIALRWNLGALLLVAGVIRPGVPAFDTVNRPTDITGPLSVSLSDIMLCIPSIAIAIALCYAVIAVFWGVPLGPRHNRIFPGSGGAL